MGEEEGWLEGLNEGSAAGIVVEGTAVGTAVVGTAVVGTAVGTAVGALSIDR